MNNIIAGLIIFCLLSVSCVSKQVVKESRSRHQLAVSLIRKCQFPLALKELNRALKLQPRDPYLHHSLGLVYFQFKKYKKAQTFLKKALKLQPHFTSARVDLGRVMIEMGSLSQGIQLLKKAQEDLTYNRPENIHALLGLAYYKQKSFSLAQKQFQIARKINTQDCTTALYHGRSFYFLKRFSSAIRLFELAKKWCVKTSSSCPAPSFDVYFFSALTYHQLGNRRQALWNLKMFLSQAKDSIYRKEALKLMKQWNPNEKTGIKKMDTL